MSDLRPIGVFDSGIGGLTVVKALRDLPRRHGACSLRSEKPGNRAALRGGTRGNADGQKRKVAGGCM